MNDQELCLVFAAAQLGKTVNGSTGIRRQVAIDRIKRALIRVYDQNGIAAPAGVRNAIAESEDITDLHYIATQALELTQAQWDFLLINVLIDDISRDDDYHLRHEQ